MTSAEWSELPASWCWVNLETLAQSAPYAITDGPFVSNLKTAHYTSAGPRVVRLQNIGEGVFLEGAAHISEKHYVALKRHMVLTGDVIVAALGERLPRACLVPPALGPAIVKADCIRVRTDESLVNARFLAWALNAEPTRRRTAAIVHGVGRPRLNLSEVKSLWIPLAPLAEQHRIVAEIEKHLTRLDAAVAGLERVRANLKRYRASVLKAACEGRLVPTEAELARAEGRDYEPASALLARVVEDRNGGPHQLTLSSAGLSNPKNGYPAADPGQKNLDALRPLPEGWHWTTVGQVGDVKLGRQRSPQHHSGDHMRPYLRVANVMEARIDLTDVKKMNFTPTEFETYELRPGDILLNEGQSLEWVGRPAMYQGEVPGCCFQNTLVRFRSSPAVLPHFALYIFLADLHTGRFQRIARWTVNIAHLGAGRFAALDFPLPPLSEQRRIVAELERTFSTVEDLERSVGVAFKRAERLRQALLKHALEGKLVPQDPNDEPASVLLERIHFERESTSAGQRNGQRGGMQQRAGKVQQMSTTVKTIPK